jgi:hypothetical protein
MTPALSIAQAGELLGRDLAWDTAGLSIALLIDQTLHGP